MKKKVITLKVMKNTKSQIFTSASKHRRCLVKVFVFTINLSPLV